MITLGCAKETPTIEYQAGSPQLPPKRWEKIERVQGLRRQGLSYLEIRKRIPFRLSKSTLSAWCKHIELTSEQLDRLDRLKSGSWYRNRLKGPSLIVYVLPILNLSGSTS